MALIERSKTPTNYVLPVILSNGITKNWYYENERLLYKAYKQLNFLKLETIRPLYPIIYID